MDTVPQDAFATLGLAEEGGEGLTGLARALLEAGVNEMMAAQADAACEAAGTTRNGFRERRLETQAGTITLRIPRLRQGTYFPDGPVERWSRVDRAVICAVVFRQVFLSQPRHKDVSRAVTYPEPLPSPA